MKRLKRISMDLGYMSDRLFTPDCVSLLSNELTKMSHELQEFNFELIRKTFVGEVTEIHRGPNLIKIKVESVYKDPLGKIVVQGKDVKTKAQYVSNYKNLKIFDDLEW